MQLSGHLTPSPRLYFWQSASTGSEMSSTSAEYYLLIYLVFVPNLKQSTASKAFRIWITCNATVS